MSLSFPTSPTVGQIYQQWVWNGTAWNSLAAGGGAPIGVQVFTTSGSYAPSPGMTSAMVETVGGGGAGGSFVGNATAGTISGAAGGGSGGYSRKYVTAAQVGASQTVTIGAGGVPGAAGNNPGGNGGTTSFGTLCVANGGGGGPAGYNPATNAAAAGQGATPGVGDFTAPGFNGGSAMNGAMGVASNFGAPSVFGGGGMVVSWQGTGAHAGLPTYGYGAGGSSATLQASGANALGIAGNPGVCIVTEFSGAMTIPAGALGPTSGNRVLLQSQTITTPVTSVDFFSGFDPTKYDEYEFIWFDWTAATEAAPGIRVSTDGSTFDTGASSYAYGFQYMGTSGTAAAAAGNISSLIQLGNAVPATSLQCYGSGRMRIPPAGIRAAATYMFNSNPAAGQYQGMGGGVYTVTTAAIVGIRFFVVGTPNITRGTFKLYGIVK